MTERQDYRSPCRRLRSQLALSAGQLILWVDFCLSLHKISLILEHVPAFPTSQELSPSSFPLLVNVKGLYYCSNYLGSTFSLSSQPSSPMIDRLLLREDSGDMILLKLLVANQDRSSDSWFCLQNPQTTTQHGSSLQNLLRATRRILWVSRCEIFPKTDDCCIIAKVRDSIPF